ncbi:hypothetical protein L1987_56862 [Smallanthus sonchifolius]|uniref:Uncharacterized protein n=1 Tax=Smallanthus sonchifolius TaxID=185202 RepID=A0ACB9DBE1_9ASTR|nr:hypothetical protein L1987_56862 [Smallanthus sonchifolius]
MKNFPWQKFISLKFVSSGEYAVFVSHLFKCDAAIKPDTWTHPWTQYERLNYPQSKKMDRCSTANMWYFPHECLNDNGSDMENGALLNKLEN